MGLLKGEKVKVTRVVQLVDTLGGGGGGQEDQNSLGDTPPVGVGLIKSFRV